MSEIIAVIRIIKMYVWETAFNKLVKKWRIREIYNIRKSMFFRGINLALFFISSKLIAFICLIVFLISGANMTTENVFVTIALINQLKDVMTFNFPYGILYGAETLISIKRIQVSIKIALIS